MTGCDNPVAFGYRRAILREAGFSAFTAGSQEGVSPTVNATDCHPGLPATSLPVMRWQDPSGQAGWMDAWNAWKCFLDNYRSLPSPHTRPGPRAPVKPASFIRPIRFAIAKHMCSICLLAE